MKSRLCSLAPKSALWATFALALLLPFLCCPQARADRYNPPPAGLTIPAAPSGYTYQGWCVTDLTCGMEMGPEFWDDSTLVVNEPLPGFGFDVMFVFFPND